MDFFCKTRKKILKIIIFITLLSILISNLARINPINIFDSKSTCSKYPNTLGCY